MPRPDAVIRAILPAIALVAVALPALVVTHPPALHGTQRVRIVTLPKRVIPPAELPAVEPLKLVDLTPEDARAYNAQVPFSTDPVPPARPFRFAGSAEDLARATDCLAAAVLYEAGDDAPGERAVAQVVLNRLRHPAFPKTVCGVVFEGAERATGCQFTFTCDGAITRWKPSEAGWRRAREIATAALAGAVFRAVGYATHYHTDWVVPYWQSSLDKIAAVHTHLFFRWSGWWGTPPAFRRAVLSGEPPIAQLAALSPAHQMGAALAQGDAAVLAAAPYAGKLPQPLVSDPDTFLVLLDRHKPADSYRAMALASCGDRSHCKLLGWSDAAAMGTAVPLTPEQIDAMSFSYLRDRTTGYERALWNCAEFPRGVAAECMKRITLRAVPPGAAPAPPAPPAGDEPLAGIRRRSGLAPQAAPAPLPTPAAPITPPRTSPAAAP